MDREIFKNDQCQLIDFVFDLSALKVKITISL